MDILRQSLAPISDRAWEELRGRAGEIFRTSLTARKFVEIDGPHGWDFGVVSTGRLQVLESEPKREVLYGLHQVKPLMETRISFKLNVWELDNISRGAEDADIEPMEEAARKIAAFEEKAVYKGFHTGGIEGLAKGTGHEVIPYPDGAESLMEKLSEGMIKFRKAGIPGPCSLVMSPDMWSRMMATVKGYPLHRQIKDLIGGEVIFSPHIDDMFLASQREGSFRLTLGHDFSMGYEQHSSKEVWLYFTESFTFQVIDPDAVIVFSHS